MHVEEEDSLCAPCRKTYSDESSHELEPSGPLLDWSSERSHQQLSTMQAHSLLYVSSARSGTFGERATRERGIVDER